jgi:hypothetical protein
MDDFDVGHGFEVAEEVHDSANEIDRVRSRENADPQGVGFLFGQPGNWMDFERKPGASESSLESHNVTFLGKFNKDVNVHLQ